MKKRLFQALLLGVVNPRMDPSVWDHRGWGIVRGLSLGVGFGDGALDKGGLSFG